MHGLEAPGPTIPTGERWNLALEADVMQQRDPDFDQILVAAERIAPYVRRTPVLDGSDLGVCGRLSLKCENLQAVGAFKARGACNAVFALEAGAARRGVVTHSSGNHAAALARAARLRGVPAFIVMPTGAPRVKRAAVEFWGGQIEECAPTLAAREATAARLQAETGATLIHPYDDVDVIAGQGTALKEFAEDAEAPDVVLVPVGGGGLLAGTALAARRLWPGTRVIGVEPMGADDAFRSYTTRTLQPQLSPRTVADGLRGALSERTLRLALAHVDDIVTVSEDAILAATRLLFDRAKLVVEPSGAVPIAALLEGRITAGRVGGILSGGNIDLDRLPWSDGLAAPRHVQ
jgi:threonine dehydratase